MVCGRRNDDVFQDSEDSLSFYNLSKKIEMDDLVLVNILRASGEHCGPGAAATIRHLPSSLLLSPFPAAVTSLEEERESTKEE